jgi:hypothetical protein
MPNENLLTKNTKICSVCKQELPYSSFYKHGKNKDGHRSNCKECQKKENWVQKNINKTNKKYRDKHKERDLLHTVQQRCRKNKRICELLEGDIVIPEKCPVLGIPLLKGLKGCYNNASVDRIDNTKGYTKDNICIISYRANVLKSNGTIQEFEKILEYMKKHELKELKDAR